MPLSNLSHTCRTLPHGRTSTWDQENTITSSSQEELAKQRWQQSIGLVRKAFLLTLTVSNSELWVTEVSELPNWEGPSAE